MTDNTNPPVGAIAWHDLTVPNADDVRKFYGEVVGWTSEPVSMGDYDDYSVNCPGSGETVAGICHARGTNADVPAQWLVYIVVADVEASAKKCVELGGKIVNEPRSCGGGKMCVIQDPAGAIAAIYQQ